MLAVVSLWLCLSVVLGQPIIAKQRDSLWVFNEPGDIVLNGLFPIRKHSDKGFGLNFEGITWMGAMIQRIREINQERLLPGNLTLGYAIHDTASDVKIGLRQTLSVLNAILNKEGKQNEAGHMPVVMGPATDELEGTSEKLYKLFDVPRLAYTTTSSRFRYSKFEKRIQTVPPDIIHVEALLRILDDMKSREFSVVVAKSSLWQERVNMFKAVLNERKSEIKLKDIIYLNTIDDDITAVQKRISCDVVIVFAESNISRSLIRHGRGSKLIVKDRTWIEVCQYDDPLLRIFDTLGELTKKVIIRNLRTNDVNNYRTDTRESLFPNNADKIVKPNWLKKVFEKHCAKSKISPSHNESSFNNECVGFRERIVSAIGHRNEFRSSLTLQGIIDSVNLIIAALRDTLETCATSTPRRCPKLSGSTLFEKLRKITLTKGKDFANSYSLQALLRVKDSAMLGRRMKTMRGWTFRKIREWRITESEIRHQLCLYRKNATHSNNVTSIPTDNNQIDGVMNSSTDNDICNHCGESMNRSQCISDNVVIAWTDTWAIVLYVLESLCLLAVLSTFVYFSQHKNSPIMILCYSWPDNVILAVLCIFSLLPMMHIGHMAPQRCMALWPIVNTIFAFYTGLLLTKTLFVQNLLKCEVATERPWRRMIYATVITFIQAVIFANLLVLDFPNSTHLSCSSRGTVTLCNIEGNFAILFSMAFNWLLMFALFALSVTETLKQRQNFCRTENLVAVATVAWISYTCSTVLAYFNIRMEQYLAVTLIQCLTYLVNSAVCLGLIYIPTLRLVSTWLRQHTRQKKNLTSIKRAQVMSSKRQSSGPMSDSLFGANFSTEQLAIPSGRHSGYYFDHRPASAVTDMSYPTSLVRSVHEQTHVVFGYGRRGTMSLNGGTSLESVPSVDWLEAASQVHSASSSYDNLSQAAEETADELTPQELLHEISTYWERHRSSDVIANGQNEDNIETNKWPSLEKLRASDL
ncbi:metabotropic glutamate receptor 8 isoform X1 [Paramuricea clavata]|uniref:Metabotropic glutamate receptor 8 isoform X1 n=1 Tax=Paramuricea clavata TaxID=317549 RepID=A0A6S7FY92_PARCT|nr:metabotropic glutamate receptor 8 isoform X1 [Paramuricea clavata]